MSKLREYVIHSIGGGWGKETFEDGLEKVSIIRGTDFPKLEIGDYSTVPVRYETEKKVKSRKIEVGDLIIEVSGGSASSGQRTGRVLYITSEILNKLGNNVIPASFCRLLRLNKDLVNPKFIAFQIKEMHLSDEIAFFENQSTGISNFQFNLFLDEFEPKIESIKQQEQVVDILESVNKKIFLNYQMNDSLEQIAQAIFKSWFIDFDPVKAKIEGGIEQAMAVISGKNATELHRLQTENPTAYRELHQLANAFPDEMVEVEGFGQVPRGWEVKMLPEVIDFLEGPGIRNWQYTEADDGINFINIRCIKNGDLSLETANKITKEEAFGKYAHFLLKEDDIVISTSGTLGRFAFVRKEHLPLCLNTSVIRLRPITNQLTLSFLNGFVRNQLQQELETKASGSVQRNFGPTHLKTISMLVPNFYLQKLHHQFVNDLFLKRQNNLKEIDHLEKLRDLLLPKLLNGEVCI